MRTRRFAPSIIAMQVPLLLAGCNPPNHATEKPMADESAAPIPGWYMEHAGQGSIQLCGQARPVRVTAAADLHERAEAFGLSEDTPVYVRVTGNVTAEGIAVRKVEQFGSPVPVTDCAMQGVVIPESG